MNETNNVVEIEKKENFFKRTGRKIGAVAKKVWPWALGGALLVGGGLLYLMLRGDEDAEDYSLLDSETPFETTGETAE